MTSDGERHGGLASEDFDAPQLRWLAGKTKHSPLAQQPLIFVAIYDDGTRT
jgi:hypothetical protein